MLKILAALEESRKNTALLSPSCDYFKLKNIYLGVDHKPLP